MSTGLWPAHPQPLPDELLSSWMIRLAHANGHKVHSFYAHYFGKDRSIWTRDIDHHGPGWLLQGLSARAGLTVEQVEALTLRGFESFAFASYNERGATRWLLSLGILHRTRTAFGQQFCPCCLEEDMVPYLRRHWRLAICVVCERHAVVLEDRCSHCGRPLAPHRGDISASRRWQLRHPLWRCTYCHEKLSCSPVPARERDVELQRHLTATVDAGWTMLSGAPVYSHLYFDGLRLLMLAARRSSAVGRQTHFERATVHERLERLRHVVDLVSDWPETFLIWSRSIRKPYTLLSRDATTIPWWLDSVLRAELLERRSRLHADEAHAILAATARIGSSANVATARRLSGRDVSVALRREPVLNEVAQTLLLFLVREVRVARGIQQLLLKRDLALLAVGRAFGLTQTVLVNLHRRDLSETSAIERIESIERALCIGRSGIVGQYKSAVRPALIGRHGSRECDALFVGVKGLPMARTSVGMRFNRAVRAARLIEAIPSWDHWVLASPTEA